MHEDDIDQRECVAHETHIPSVDQEKLFVGVTFIELFGARADAAWV